MALTILINLEPTNAHYGASLVVQGLKICLAMQGTEVRSLVWEDSACCRATKPMYHNY